MKCPKCDHPIKLPYQRQREIRKAQGLCIVCGHPAHGYYRCQTCRSDLALKAHAAKQQQSTLALE